MSDQPPVPPGGSEPPPPPGPPPGQPPAPPGPPLGGTPPPPPGQPPAPPVPPAPPAPPAGGQPPVPPGPPAQPYNAGPPPLDVGTAIGYGWKKFQEYAKEFVLLTLAAFVVIVFWNFVSSFIQNNLPTNLFGTLLALGIAVIGFVISMLVQAGVWRAGLAVTRGEAPNVNMLTQTDNLGPYILTSIVVGIGAFIGIILCVIPGIIWLVMTAYAPLVALDKGVGPGEAISTSIDWVKNNAGRVILVLLVAYIVYALGIIACCVGLLVSIPVALVAITYSYRILGNEPVAP